MPQRVAIDQVNAFVWRKQHLAPGNADGDVESVVRDVVALHATSAPTPHLSLRARMVQFEPEQLNAGIYVTRRLVKVLCMRQTVHVVASSDLGVVSAATGERLRRNARRELRQLVRWAGASGAAEEESALARLQSEVAEIIRLHGPSTAAELSDAIPALHQRITYAPDKAYASEMALGSLLLPRLTMLGLLVRGRARGSWRSNQHEYALLDDWLPQGDLPPLPPDGARAQLLRRYLAAFGPASIDDAAWWAGWSKGEAQRALSARGEQVVQLDIPTLGAGYWLLASDLPALLSTPRLDDGAVQFLPSLDGYIMGYKDRRRFLDPQHYDQVFDRSGNAYATVWVDGLVVGVWREADGGIEVLVWEDRAATQVAAEAARLGLFIRQADGDCTRGAPEVQVRNYPPDLYVKTPFTLGPR